MSRRFGWCLDDQHDDCRVMVPGWNGDPHRCTCDCHGGQS